MIVVNGKKVSYDENMTVSTLLKKMKYVFPMLVVRINGTLIPKKAYDISNISDGDTIDIIHLVSGG